jgi:hypothetical protein
MRLLTALMLSLLLPGSDRLDDLKRKFQRSLHDAEDPFSDCFGRKMGYRRITEIPRNLEEDGYESFHKDVPHDQYPADDI